MLSFVYQVLRTSFRHNMEQDREKKISRALVTILQEIRRYAENKIITTIPQRKEKYSSGELRARR